MKIQRIFSETFCMRLPDFPTPFCPRIAILNGRLLADIDKRRNIGEPMIGDVILLIIKLVLGIGHNILFER